MKKVVVILLILSTLTACENKEQTGALTGAVIGGLIGSRFGHGGGRVLATAGGTVVGAMIGGSIGRSMDKIDRMEMDRALESTPDRRHRKWTNPNTGYRYDVEPRRTYYSREKRPCREYRTTAYIEGKKETVWGRACRTEEGDWEVVRG